MAFEKKVIKLDVLVLGDMAVGKTALLSRFMYDTFEQVYYPTFGVDFLTKMLYRPEHVLRVQFWDSAGRKCFENLLPSYIRDTHLVMVAYDVTKRSSFDVAQSLVEKVRRIHGSDVFILMVANKCDVVTSDRQVTFNEGSKKAKELGVCYAETSAQSSVGVKAAFERLLTAGVLSLNNESMLEKEEKEAEAARQKREAEVADLVLPSLPQDNNKIDSWGCGLMWKCIASAIKTGVYGVQSEASSSQPAGEAC